MSRRVGTSVLAFALLVAGGVVAPTRVYGSAPALGTDDTIEVQVAGVAGVAADAEAAVLNVTAIDATTSGFLTVFPCGGAPPDTSSVNYAPGVTVPNLVIAALSVDGTVCVHASTPVSAIIDVAGWFPSGSNYQPLVPQRVLDTRLGNGAPVGSVAAGQMVHLLLLGRGGVPATGVSAGRVEHDRHQCRPRRLRDRVPV